MTLQQFETPGGQILVEAEEDLHAGKHLTPQGPGAAPVRAEQSFDSALDTVKAAAAAFARRLASIPDRPDTAMIELALNFTAEVAVGIARTAGAAQLKVALAWKAAAPPSEREP